MGAQPSVPIMCFIVTNCIAWVRRWGEDGGMEPDSTLILARLNLGDRPDYEQCRTMYSLSMSSDNWRRLPFTHPILEQKDWP